MARGNKAELIERLHKLNERRRSLLEICGRLKSAGASKYYQDLVRGLRRDIESEIVKTIEAFTEQENDL